MVNHEPVMDGNRRLQSGAQKQRGLGYTPSMRRLPKTVVKNLFSINLKKAIKQKIDF